MPSQRRASATELVSANMLILDYVAELRAALVRLLWDSVADDAICTCAPGDVCPLCQAAQALGLGRWRGARWAQRVLPPDRADRPAARPRKRAARDTSRSTHR